MHLYSSEYGSNKIECSLNRKHAFPIIVCDKADIDLLMQRKWLNNIMENIKATNRMENVTFQLLLKQDIVWK